MWLGVEGKWGLGRGGLKFGRGGFAEKVVGVA